MSKENTTLKKKVISGSVATQTPPDVGLRPIPYTGRKVLLTGDRTGAASRSKSSNKYALNRVTTRPKQ